MPSGSGSPSVIWVRQGGNNKWTNNSDAVARYRFLKVRKISNGHSSFEIYPSVGGRWKGLSIQIWHMLPPLLAAYYFTYSNVFLPGFFASFPTFPYQQNCFLWGSLYSLSRRYSSSVPCALFGLCLYSTLLGVYFPGITISNTKTNQKRLFFSVHY